MATCIKNIGLLLNPKPGMQWEEIRDAAILFDDKIIRFGLQVDILPIVKQMQADIVDANGCLVTPGLVDSHTHPAFAEARLVDFEMRSQGKTYREIAAVGGGIRSSVRSLRAISEEDLIQRMMPRLDRFLEYGTTTIEAKSGYGLSTAEELKQLRAIKWCNDNHPLELIPTLLAAHEIPDEYRSDRRAYIDVILNETIPSVAREGLAEFCDVFCEEGVFSVEESRKVLLRGKEFGLLPKIHADQLSGNGGAELAAEVGAVSAEHLDFISDHGIEKMIRSGVVFTLLPGAVIFLGLNRYPPADRIREQGGIMAIATDFNPGSSPTQNLPLMMTLACTFCKLSVRESLWAATFGGALALRREGEIGTLQAGYQADIVIWEGDDERMIPYYFGMNLVKDVFKAGKQIVTDGRVISDHRQQLQNA